MENNLVINMVNDIAPLPYNIQSKIVYMKDDHGGNNLWKIVSETDDMYLVISRTTIVEIGKDSVYYDGLGKCYCSNEIVDIGEIDDRSIEIESEGKWEEWASKGDTWTNMWRYCGELNGIGK
jgi:hypothetical protein